MNDQNNTPGNRAVILKVRTFLAVMGMFFLFTPALSEAQSLPRRGLPPGKALEQRAAAMLRLGRPEAAVDLYLEALYKNPGNSLLYYQLSQLLPGKENASTLLQIVDDILKSQPGDDRLRAEKGRLLYLLEKEPEARQIWEQIIRQKQQDRFIYTTVTNAMLKAGATEEAINVLQGGRVNLGDQTLFTYDLARIYAARHDYTMATQEYLAHLDKNPGMLDPIANQLIRLLENDGAAEAVRSGFKVILASEGPHHSVTLARAKILLHEKQYEDCAQIVLSMNSSKSMKEILAIANDLKGEQAWLPAAKLYLFISANSKNDRLRGEALLNLASTYEQQMDSGQTYRSLAAYFPGNQFFELDLRIMQSEDASLQRTLQLYDSLQIMLPQTRQAYLAAFHIAELNLTTSGDVDRAIRGFKRIFESAPYTDIRLMAGRRLVEANLSKGDTQTARQTLERVIHTLRLDEDDPVIIASRIKIFMHQTDIAVLLKELRNLSGAARPADPLFNDGMELQALIEGNGGMDDPRLREYFKAERLIGQHKLSEAVRILAGIQGPASSIADEALVRAVQLLLILGNTAQASQEMDRFLASATDSPWRPTILVWRAEQFQFVAGDPRSAIPYYESLIVDHPDYLEIQEIRQRLRSMIGSGS